MRRSEFVLRVLERVGAHLDPQRIACGVTWATFEDTKATWNPFATTEPWEDATEFNSVGVKNYISWVDGVDATVATLKNGSYEHLLKMLRSRTATVHLVLGAISSSPWGSHPTGPLYNEVVAHWGRYDIEVSEPPIGIKENEVSDVEDRDAAAVAALLTVGSEAVTPAPAPVTTDNRVGGYDRRQNGATTPLATGMVENRVGAYDRRVLNSVPAPVVTPPTERRVGAYDRRVTNPLTSTSPTGVEGRVGAYDRRVTNPLVTEA